MENSWLAPAMPPVCGDCGLRASVALERLNVLQR